MSWMETDFEIEQKLEAKQIEQELKQMMDQDKSVNWDFMDDEIFKTPRYVR